jgi:hypothetical protein
MRRAEERRWHRRKGDHEFHVGPALEAVWFQPIITTVTFELADIGAKDQAWRAETAPEPAPL